VTIACPPPGTAAPPPRPLLQLQAVTSSDRRVVGRPQPEPSELILTYDSAPALEVMLPEQHRSGHGSAAAAVAYSCRGSSNGRHQELRWSSNNAAWRTLPGRFVRLIRGDGRAEDVHNLTVTVVLGGLGQ
jgi:hypothetical protein